MEIFSRYLYFFLGREFRRLRWGFIAYSVYKVLECVKFITLLMVVDGKV